MPYWLRGMPAPSNPGGQQVVEHESSEHVDALYDEPEVSGQQELPPPTTTATTTNVSPPPPTVATAQTNMATPQRLHVTCGKFDPVVNEDPHMFWQLFIKFVTLLNLTERQMLDYLPFYLEGVAKEWFFQLPETIKSNLTRVKEAFLERFSPNTPFNLEVWELNQGENETVENFIHRVKRSARNSQIPEDFLMARTMRGLKKEIGAIVMPQRPTDMEDLRQKGITAEITINIMKSKPDTSPKETAAYAMYAPMMDMASSMNAAIAAMNSLKEDLKRDRNLPYHQERQQYHGNQTVNNQSWYQQPPQEISARQVPPPDYFHGQPQIPQQGPPQGFHPRFPQNAAQRPPASQDQGNRPRRPCFQCGKHNCNKRFCIAKNHICMHCKRRGHFDAFCIPHFIDNMSQRFSQTNMLQ